MNTITQDFINIIMKNSLKNNDKRILYTKVHLHLSDEEAESIVSTIGIKAYEIMGEIYEELFSEEEIKVLKEIYENPVFKKNAFLKKTIGEKFNSRIATEVIRYKMMLQNTIQSTIIN